MDLKDKNKNTDTEDDLDLKTCPHLVVDDAEAEDFEKDEENDGDGDGDDDGYGDEAGGVFRVIALHCCSWIQMCCLWQ